MIQKKNERVNFRVTEYDKMKMLTKANTLNCSLSDYVYTIIQLDYDKDVIDLFVDCVKQIIIDRNRNDYNSVITHYTLEDGTEVYNFMHLKDSYGCEFDLVSAVNDYFNGKFDTNVLWKIVDSWEEVVKRLSLLGWYADEVNKDEIAR